MVVLVVLLLLSAETFTKRTMAVSSERIETGEIGKRETGSRRNRWRGKERERGIVTDREREREREKEKNSTVADEADALEAGLERRGIGLRLVAGTQQDGRRGRSSVDGLRQRRTLGHAALEDVGQAAAEASHARCQRQRRVVAQTGVGASRRRRRRRRRPVGGEKLAQAVGCAAVGRRDAACRWVRRRREADGAHLLQLRHGAPGRRRRRGIAADQRRERRRADADAAVPVAVRVGDGRTAQRRRRFDVALYVRARSHGEARRRRWHRHGRYAGLERAIVRSVSLAFPSWAPLSRKYDDDTKSGKSVLNLMSSSCSSNLDLTRTRSSIDQQSTANQFEYYSNTVLTPSKSMK